MSYAHLSKGLEADNVVIPRVADQAILVAQAQSHGSALQQRLDDLERQLGNERKSHEDTRALLAAPWRCLSIEYGFVMRCFKPTPR